MSNDNTIYYWNKVTVHHLKLCNFLMKKDNTMICGVLLNHCLTVNRIISKSVCLDTRLRDTSLKRCGVKSQFTNSVSCVTQYRVWQRRRMRRRRRRMRRRCQACINANDGHTRYWVCELTFDTTSLQGRVTKPSAQAYRFRDYPVNT